MNPQTWTAVDDFLTELIVKPDAALADALSASAAAGLPEINVTPAQGKLLYLLARLIRAERILEIGTLGGYSTIWLARGLRRPDGRLVTLESDPKHAAVAQQNFNRAGLTEVVELRVGRAIDALPRLQAENRGPFDLVFIDADKPTTPEYFQWSLKLTRPGSLIIVDNIVRKGAILDGEPASATGPGEPASAGGPAEVASIQGIRRFLDLAANEPRVEVTALQTVGSKGYDGLALCWVKEN
jgi:predicted O-methyltransferase YrrM